MKQLLKNIITFLGLKPLALAIRLRIKLIGRRLLFFYLMTKSRVTGRSYTAFYEEMMDRRAEKGGFMGKEPEAVTGTPDQPRRSFAAKYFAEQKMLTPDMTMLDYGCGNVATGVHFIAYLNEQKYTGADISSSCLKVGQKWITEAGLDSKNPELVHLPGGSLEKLAGRKFDFIYSQDVIVHMPPENVEELLKNITPYIAENGSFYFTYTLGDSDVEYQNDYVNWHYGKDYIERAVKEAGMNVEHVESFNGVEYKNSPKTRMVRAYLS